MPVATSDFYSVLRRLVDEWQACQTQLEANAIESVEAFLAATERDEDGHRWSPALDRLNAAEAEIRAKARWLADARDFGCELLARDLDDWTDCEISRYLSFRKGVDREPLAAALEELPGHRQEFVLEQLRKRYPEQLAAIEGNRLDGVAEQATPQPLANDGSDAARAVIEIADDHRSARWGDRTFSFTAMQGSVVAVLFEFYSDGKPGVSQAYLQETLEFSSTVRGLFSKGKHDAITSGFIMPVGKGLWSLAKTLPD